MIRRILSFFAFSFLLLAVPVNVFAGAAILSLDPSVGTFNRGCSFSLNVNLDTGGTQTDGTDAILIYDTSRFTAVSVTNGTIYPDYPGNNIDAQSGKITMAGLASVSTPFTGKGTLSTVNFKVNDNATTGATQITFDFNPQKKDETRDSNVVERTTIVDVLNSVVNGNYTIGTGACNAQPSPSSAVTSSPGPRGGPDSSSTPSAQPTQPAQPKTIDCAVDKTCKGTGTIQLTSTVAIVGGILTILGILGLALL